MNTMTINFLFHDRDSHHSLLSFTTLRPFLISEFKKELKHLLQPNSLVNKRLKPNPIKARISHRNSVPFRYLNTMIIQPKYNSPSSDVVNSNVPPLHCDGSHPIGGFLLGD